MAGNSEGIRKGWTTRKAKMAGNGGQPPDGTIPPERVRREVLNLREVNSSGRGRGYSSGLKLSMQNIQEEYVPSLMNLPDKIAMFERMANDSTVKANLRGNIYPLISSVRWKVEGGEEEHRELVAANLLRDGPRELWCDTPFQQRLFEQAQQLKYGFMGFGKTREIVDGLMIFRRLTYLHPRSFSGINGPWEWDSTGSSLVAIHRAYTLSSGKTVADERIPVEDVFLGVWELTGENWEGVALIRPAFKDWAMKEQAEKIDMVDLQNRGVGIPYGKLAPGGGLTDASHVKTIVQDLRGGSKERQFFVLNDGEEVSFLTASGAGSLASPVVDQHTRGIASSAAMTFMGDGNTESGSRASGSVHALAYYQSVEAIKVILQEQINHGCGYLPGLVEEEINSNYDDVEECPQIVGSPVSPSTQLDNAQLIGQLIQNKALSRDLAAENYLRKSLGMPEIDPVDFQRILERDRPVPAIGGRPPEVGDTDREDPRDDKLGRAVGLKESECGVTPHPKKRTSWPWLKSTAA